MRAILVSISLVFAASLCNADISRIVGGEATTITQYPSITQVEKRVTLIWLQSCSANIVTTRFLLSAAQCFDTTLLTRNFRIRAGTANRGSGGIVAEIAKISNHPSYSKSTHDGDICVVELAAPLTFSDTIRRVAIITRNHVLPDNAPVILAGWGAQRQLAGTPSSVLHHVEAFTINRTECATRYQAISRTVTDNMICAGISDGGGRDHCDGDAGGPLYHENILVGIISWNYRCGHRTYPGVSTNIAGYTDWIVATAV